MVGDKVSPDARATAEAVLQLNGVAPALASIAAAKDADGSDAIRITAATEVALNFTNFVGSERLARVGAGPWAAAASIARGTCVRSQIGRVNIYNNAKVTGENCGLAAATRFFHGRPAVVDLADRSQGDANKPYASDPRILAIRQRLDRMRSPGWPFGSVSPVFVISRTAPASSDDRVVTGSPAVLASGSRLRSLTASSAEIRIPGTDADPSCSRPTSFSGDVTLSG